MDEKGWDERIAGLRAELPKERPRPETPVGPGDVALVELLESFAHQMPRSRAVPLYRKRERSESLNSKELSGSNRVVEGYDLVAKGWVLTGTPYESSRTSWQSARRFGVTVDGQAMLLELDLSSAFVASDLSEERIRSLRVITHSRWGLECSLGDAEPPGSVAWVQAQLADHGERSLGAVDLICEHVGASTFPDYSQERHAVTSWLPDGRVSINYERTLLDDQEGRRFLYLSRLLEDELTRAKAEIAAAPESANGTGERGPDLDGVRNSGSGIAKAEPFARSTRWFGLRRRSR